MELLLQNGFTAQGMSDFVSENVSLTPTQTAFTETFRDYTVVYKKEQLREWANKQMCDGMCWQEVKDMMEAIFLRRQLILTGETILPQYAKILSVELHKTIGASLLSFILQKTLLFVAVSPTAFCPLDENMVREAVNRAEVISKEEKRQMLLKGNEKKKKFLKKLSLKCKKFLEKRVKKKQRNKVRIVTQNIHKKTRRRMKKTKPPLNPVLNPGNLSSMSNKKGYAQVEIPTSKFSFHINTFEKWSTKSFLNDKPPTPKEVKDLLVYIFCKDVGVNMCNAEEMSKAIESFLDLRSSLMHFLQKHRKLSKGGYQEMLFKLIRDTDTHSQLFAPAHEYESHDKLVEAEVENNKVVHIESDMEVVAEIERDREVEAEIESSEVILIETGEVVQIESDEEVLMEGDEVVQIESDEEVVQIESDEEVVQIENDIEVLQIENDIEVVQLENDIQVEINDVQFQNDEVVQNKSVEEIVHIDNDKEDEAIQRDEVVQIQSDKEFEAEIQIVEVVHTERDEEIVNIESVYQRGSKRHMGENIGTEFSKKQRVGANQDNRGEREKAVQVATLRTFNCVGRSSKKHHHPVEPVDTKIVRLFLRAVLNKVLLLSLFGTPDNKRTFVKFCCRFANCSLFQTFRLTDLMSQLKISRIKWLQGLWDLRLKENILAKVVLWLLEDYVVELICMCFYVTNVCQGRHKLWFYLQRSYQKLTGEELKKLIESKKLKRIVGNPKLLAAYSERLNAVGLSKLRMVPKKKGGVRPIIQTGPKLSKENVAAHMAKVLLQQVVQERKRTPLVQSIGMHCVLKQYWHLCKRNNSFPLYFVRTDIQDAFGSINQQILWNILKAVIPKGKVFKCEKYECITTRGGNVRHHYCFSFNHLPHVMPSDSILVKKEVTEVKANDMLRVLRYTVKTLAVKFRSHNYLLMRGIPQGGMLSPVLCDLYYSHMDAKHLSEFLNVGDLLLRTVDDYLYITPDKSRAQRFLEVVQNGIVEYNCTLNKAKTYTNIATDVWPMRKDISFFGCQIYLENFQISADFSSYYQEDVAHSMKLVGPSPSRIFQQRLRVLAAIKLDAVALDEEYNTRATVIKNIFSSALMHALRMHAVVKTLFNKKDINNFFIAKSVTESTRRIANRVNRIVKKHKLESSLDFNSVCYITYKAYNKILQRQKSLYPGALRAIAWLLYSVSTRLQADVHVELDQFTEKLPHVFQTMK